MDIAKNPQQQKMLLSVREFASITGIQATEVRQMIAAGMVIAYRSTPAGKWYIKASELECFYRRMYTNAA